MEAVDKIIPVESESARDNESQRVDLFPRPDALGFHATENFRNYLTGALEIYDKKDGADIVIEIPEPRRNDPGQIRERALDMSEYGWDVIILGSFLDDMDDWKKDMCRLGSARYFVLSESAHEDAHGRGKVTISEGWEHGEEKGLLYGAKYTLSCREAQRVCILC